MAKIKLAKLTQDDFEYLYDFNRVEYETTFEIVGCIKLRGLIKKRIRELKRGDNLGFHYEINMLQTLLKESKNEN